MTHIAVAGNAFPGLILGQTPRHALADENHEDYAEQGYRSMQLDLLNSEKGTPHRRPTHEIQVILGIPMLLQSQSFGRETSDEPICEPIDSFLERQRELVDILQNKPASVETQEERARPLFLLPIALSENSKRVVGENGLKRFHEFKRYPDGWDNGRGSALSARSVRLLNSFLKDLPEIGACEPSLFLTHQGDLQLGWEDVSGNVVELEFFPDRIEYYIELLNEEGSVGLEDQSQLLEKIRSTVE